MNSKIYKNVIHRGRSRDSSNMQTFMQRMWKQRWPLWPVNWWMSNGIYAECRLTNISYLKNFYLSRCNHRNENIQIWILPSTLHFIPTKLILPKRFSSSKRWIWNLLKSNCARPPRNEYDDHLLLIRCVFLLFSMAFNFNSSRLVYKGRTPDRCVRAVGYAQGKAVAITTPQRLIEYIVSEWGLHNNDNSSIWGFQVNKKIHQEEQKSFVLKKYSRNKNTTACICRRLNENTSFNCYHSRQLKECRWPKMHTHHQCWKTRFILSLKEFQKGNCIWWILWLGQSGNYSFRFFVLHSDH